MMHLGNKLVYLCRELPAKYYPYIQAPFYLRRDIDRTDELGLSYLYDDFSMCGYSSFLFGCDLSKLHRIRENLYQWFVNADLIAVDGYPDKPSGIVTPIPNSDLFQVNKIGCVSAEWLLNLQFNLPLVKRPAWRGVTGSANSIEPSVPEYIPKKAAPSDRLVSTNTKKDNATIQCDTAWADIQKHTDEILAGDDMLARNQRISAAYAQLYQDNPDLTWVGLAAVVSRQVGCAMEQAGSKSNYPVVGNDANTIREALEQGNEAIFSDIYPVTQFYQQHGLEGLEQCPDRSGIGEPVSDDLKDALQTLDDGYIRDASDDIAVYEQREIAQTIYDNPQYAEAFNRLQSAPLYALPRLLGMVSFDIAVSAECHTGKKIPFSGDITNPDHRVNYYELLMDEFERIDQATITKKIMEQAG